MKEIKVIQASKPHTGSTLLTNLIYGLLCPEDLIYFSDTNCEKLVTKSDNLDINSWEENFSEYELYFICSIRKDEKINVDIDEKYKSKNNVLVIDYSRLNEINSTNNVDYIFDLLINFLPKSIIPQEKDLKLNMINRFNLMNQTYESIKHKSLIFGMNLQVFMEGIGIEKFDHQNTEKVMYYILILQIPFFIFFHSFLFVITNQKIKMNHIRIHFSIFIHVIFAVWK